MCRHIFSHPDYDRRLWHFTRSADPDVREGRRALAGSPHCMAYRRWGIAPRPEDVLHVVLTTFGIVRLSGFWGGICLLRVGVWGMGYGVWGRGAGDGFLRRLARGRPGVRGSTIAVRSLRSGLPLRHPRCRLRRLPSDSLGRIDSPRTPGHPRARLCQLNHGASRGEWCAWRFAGGRGRRGGGCGVAKKGRAGGRFWHLGGLRGRGRCARLGARRLEAGLSYFAVPGGFAAVVVLAASAVSTTSAGSGFSAFFFFFFGSASIVPRHGGVPHRQR